jgi:hypothetical protein
MPIPRLPNDIAYCTTRIECTRRDGLTSTGTGFHFHFNVTPKSHIPALITNKHVIKDASTGKFWMNLEASDGGPLAQSHQVIELQNFDSYWIPHPDPAIDLCALPLAPVEREFAANGQKLFDIGVAQNIALIDDRLEEVTQVEDVVMAGYPIGLWDHVNNMPIIRRGCTATHPALNYVGRDEVLIDIACYPGSSGSPVFIYNQHGYIDGKRGRIEVGKERIFFLGVLYSGYYMSVDGEIVVRQIPTQFSYSTKVQVPINLGGVIRASKVLDFEPILKRINGA